jgi:D-alanyl-D-alanine carboxypeptidase
MSFCILFSFCERAVKKSVKGSFYGLLFLSFFITLLLFSESFAAMIHARAAVAVDADTGKILFDKNSSRRLPPASTTKLMTAIVAIENGDLSKVVTISKNASRVSPSKAGFKEGDKITIEGLLYAALVQSANDAAVALAEAVAGSEKQFVCLMNKKAASLGARNTRFINSNGLPGPGQYTTALDLARILIYGMSHPKLIEIIGTPDTQIQTEDGRVFFLKNTDKLLWSDEKVIGGKTGYTRSAKHCFVGAAANDKGKVVVALLGSPSRKSLWMETERLINKNLHDKNA